MGVRFMLMEKDGGTGYEQQDPHSVEFEICFHL